MSVAKPEAPHLIPLEIVVPPGEPWVVAVDSSAGGVQEGVAASESAAKATSDLVELW
jgi:hypothetical protein